MRRWWTAVAVGAVAVLGLVGCAPAGLDADLTDDWPAPAAAQTFVPAAGVCHHAIQDVGYLTSYNPVACTESHRVETLHVGTLSGAGAERSTPPPAGSVGMRAARAECDREINKAVGADWRTGKLAVDVVFPSPPAWTGGARWFRCDVSETKGLDDTFVGLREGSLRDALKGDSKLAYRCFDPKLVKDDVDEMVPAACTGKHHAEFVGVYQAPDISYAEFTRTTLRIHKACQKMIADYVKVPNDNNLQYRAGTIFYHPFEQEWRNGNRGVQCFLWVSDRALTRSMKGAGTKGLPVT
ncbi:septum formation family protein [Micromonospora sp. WMMD812]|uniref:septum formation family protein n=1 Tax=Micromonospora sp. WMMD812 TaxID=3015152 RepID=UPI00248B1C3E|nr:septum formation family protein [Micromonospora sp. WMMD812]WBB69660.1 septum formation family protein [Micromonospora sp. WMMD812]